MSDIKVPELAESITEATISQWLKSEGDVVSQGDVLAELETDKVNVELTAEENGRLEKILRGPGETVQVGEVVAVLKEITDEDTASSKEESVSPENQSNRPEEAPDKTETQQSLANEAANEEHHTSRSATPAARRLARERGIDLDSVKSYDPLGRISADDVKKSSKKQPEPQQTDKASTANTAKQATNKQQPSSANKQPATTEKPVEHIPMTKRRQVIAERLVQAQQTAAMLTTFNEVDMTAILDVRKRRQEKFVEQHNIKLGFMSFFTKAVVGALKAFPFLNAEIRENEILLKKYYDIGIAVAADEGLVVPVVRDADRLSFAGLEKSIADLAGKARSKKLSLSDLQGGTFTITNGGVFGSLLSTPILNAPQVGILGMHTIQWRPVAIDKERMENRPMMYIALSYDHRIVDGKEAVSFLVKVKELLEDPETLLLEG
jgi:2-oxoglutarate dehydrogenase E2 component (dihydrolipoamide succinyltransferase)